MSETFDADGRRWIHRYPPLNRYVIKFEAPADKGPYVGLLEDKVKRLEARVAELEWAHQDDVYVEFYFPSATAACHLDDMPADYAPW